MIKLIKKQKDRQRKSANLCTQRFDSPKKRMYAKVGLKIANRIVYRYITLLQEIWVMIATWEIRGMERRMEDNR